MRHDVLDVARNLIQFDTRNPPGDERECARYIGGLLTSAGFRVSYHEFSEKRLSLVATLEGEGVREPLCFAGHIDVVSLGQKPWSTNPFGGDIIGNKLFGRGASDMKGGVAAFVSMGLNLAAETTQRRGSLVLVVCAGEETGCEGSAHLAKAGALGKVGALLVAEPTSNSVFLGHRGALWLKASTKGRSAHGSMPDLGDNAIYKAATAVAKLITAAQGARSSGALEGVTLNVGTFCGGTNINSVPDHAEFRLDVRTRVDHDHSLLQQELKNIIGKDIELEVLRNLAPVATNPQDRWVRDVTVIVESVVGSSPVELSAPYFTDASVLTAEVGYPPTIILGPGEMDMAHKMDEFCYVSRILESASIYEKIARNWCCPT